MFCGRRGSFSPSSLPPPSPALFLYGCLVPRRYAEEVRLYARQAGLEEELVFAVIRAESNFRADAVSPAGAVGLMQIMPQTALFVEELSGRRLDVRDPAENIDLGTAYLRYLFGRFSSLTQVLAAYNAGEGTVRTWLSRADLTDTQGGAGAYSLSGNGPLCAESQNFL